MRSIATKGSALLFLCLVSVALRPAHAFLSTSGGPIRCGRSSLSTSSLSAVAKDLATDSLRGDEDESNDQSNSPVATNRRGAIFALGSLAPVLAAALTASPLLAVANEASADVGASVRGTPVTPFNSLMFQYRGNDFAGLRAEDLNEPSISYREFMDSLKAGQVSFVEFLAPDGDAAYATIKDRDRPIRIGEGYPIEQHDGYSSPAFAIRAVQNAGVPYKFVVPGLAKFSTSTTTTTASRQ